MCLLRIDNPERINVTDRVRVFLRDGSTIDGVVKKTPGWLSREWVILGSGVLSYFKDYRRIILLKKTRVDKNHE